VELILRAHLAPNYIRRHVREALAVAGEGASVIAISVPAAFYAHHHAAVDYEEAAAAAQIANLIASHFSVRPFTWLGGSAKRKGREQRSGGWKWARPFTRLPAALPPPACSI
jgi:hypothetical protein